jgi:hypothetical protein
MANASDEILLQAFKDLQARTKVTVGTIASDPRAGSTMLSASLQGRVQFTVNVADSGVSRSSGSIS